MFKVFYYYYYIFYTKIIPDNQPHSTVIFTLGFTYSLIINGLINIIFAYFFGFTIGKWEMIAVAGLFILGLYFLLYRSGIGRNIVEKEKPKILGSKNISITLSIFLFVLAMLSMFLEPILTKYLLQNK